MKKTCKNFIAFTLSEIMIVLLIVSVISAATLPAITGKKVKNPLQVGSTWQSDTSYDLGHFYIGANNNEVVIGQDTSKLSVASINADITNNGNAALKLRRLNSREILLNAGPYVNYGNSDIAFYNQENKFAGKFAADERGNIAVGIDSAKQDININLYGNLFLGHYAGAYRMDIRDVSYSYAQYNTIVGNNAARNSIYRTGNVVVGQNTSDISFGDYNVAIGNDSSSYSNYGISNRSISIGSSASFARYRLVDSVNLGYSSGAASEDFAVNAKTNDVRFQNAVNIGYNAGYLSGYTYASLTSPSYNAAYSVVNLGSNAGANQSFVKNGVPLNLKDSVSIGYYAGYSSTAPINIGAYAGAYRSGIRGAINIGEFAGAGVTGYADISETGAINSGMNNENINIGNHAGYGYLGPRNNGHCYIDPYPYNPYVSKMINIGNYAGANSSHAYNVINIGDYAGFGLTYSNNQVDSVENHNINIGYSSGRWRDSGSLKSELGGSIHIGDTGAYGTNRSQVIIGCEGHSIKAPYRMCIGGKYPYANSWINGTDATGSKSPFFPNDLSENKYSSLFLPPGIQHLSDSGFPHTNIFLIAKYIIGYSSTFSTFSDRTLKENIKPTSDGIKKVRKLNIREFNIKNDKSPRVGVIAQELMEIYPNLVSKTKLPNGKEYYTVRYDRFVYSLAQAIKDVDNIALGLQTEVNDNMKLLKKLSNKVLSLEERLNNLSNSDKLLEKRLKEIDSIISKVEYK